MKYSVVHSKNDMYRITITSETENEKIFLEKPLDEVREIVYQHFDQAVREKLGEGATIGTVADDSGFPYQIFALISIKEN